MIRLTENYFKSVRCVKYPNEMMKIVFETVEKSDHTVLTFGDSSFKELHNYIEPYEKRAHVFIVPQKLVSEKIKFTYTFKNGHKNSVFFKGPGEEGIIESVFDPSCEADHDTLVDEDFSRITVQKTLEVKVSDGVVSKTYDCLNKRGEKVKMFALFVDPEKAIMYTGTPDNEFKAGNCSQTVQGEIDAAVKAGFNVVAATNADFFEMHTDCMPSGLVIKEGKVVANPDSDRPFFAVKADGTPVISTLLESPGIKEELYSAVCGREIIMKDGKEAELGLLEPFGYTRHPRTCVGILPDNKYVILVVDSRIPEYSNGATLTDLYMIMKSFGAVRAINLDGGGSSTMIIKTRDEGFKMINHPADLIRPFDNLIRDVYDSMLIVAK